MWKYNDYMEEWGSEKAQQVGIIMRDDRKAAGYTIRGLAEELGMSPTHLNRMEKGERMMDSVQKLIQFCDLCKVPIEKYLILFGLKISEEETLLRRAFPGIKNDNQEFIITEFANLVTSKGLSSEELTQMINTATAYAEFCEKNRSLK